MPGRLKRRALLASAMVAASSVVLVAASSTVALASGGGPVWQPVQSFNTGLPVEGLFDAANCSGAGSCLAGGVILAGTTATPVVVASSNGTWGQAATPGVSGVSGGESVVTSLACTSASACVGVGYNEDTSNQEYVPLAGTIAVSGSTVTPAALSALTLPTSPAGSATEQAALAAVSCTTSSCTAVGYYLTSGDVEEPLVATGGPGAWSLSSLSGPSTATKGANLTAVSCPSDGPCEAVGNYLDSSGDANSWAVQLSGSETPQTITPPAGSVATTATLPTAPLILTSLGDGPAMGGISCPSVGACTAVGSYGVGGGATAAMAVTIGNGAATSLPDPAFAITALTGVWCVDAGDCTIDGDLETGAGTTPALTPITGYERAGTWSSLTTLPGGTPGSTLWLLAGLGCSSVDDCLSVGFGITESGGSPTAITPGYSFSAGQLSVTTSSLPAATVGQPYSATLQSSGGAGPATWSITNGSLPAGLSLDGSTGVISGTPTAGGSASFSAQLSDGPPAQTASASLSITVSAVPAVPRVSAAVTRVTSKGLTLALGCSGSGTCKGTAVVKAIEHLRGHTPTAVTARAKKKTVKVTLARGSYSLAAGQVRKLTLKLTGKAKALLQRLHHISGKLTLMPAGATRPSLSRTVTFKSAAKKKKRHG